MGKHRRKKDEHREAADAPGPRGRKRAHGAATAGGRRRAAGAAAAAARLPKAARSRAGRAGRSAEGQALEPGIGPVPRRVEPGPRALDAAGRTRHRHVDLFEAYEAIHYREFKILLRAEDFSDDLGRDVHDYWKLARRVAGQLLLHVRRGGEEDRPRVREIAFLDTPGSDLWRNSFMLRVRRPLVDGVPDEACELTLKFRDADIFRALEIAPAAGAMPAKSKFKEEILLVESGLGGMRSVFSHTCQIKGFRGPLPRTFGEARELFPVLSLLPVRPRTRLAPAVGTKVEEALYELGELGFRGPKTAKVDMAVWREASSGRVLVGEFAYETHFRHYGRLNPIPKLRSERLYRLLQRETGAWVELGTTKTSRYYDLAGPRVHDE